MSKTTAVAPSALLAACTLLLFFRAGGFDFVGFDDAGHIFANPSLQPASLRNALHFWVAPSRLYMPVVFDAWSLLAAAVQAVEPGARLRDCAWLFHSANIVVHTLNVLLVYSILMILPQEGGSKWAAFAGALLFAWHPLQVEPVAWASGMKDLLCGFFSLAALRAYVGFVREPAQPRPLYGLAVLSYCLALAAKPAAIAVPLFKLALDAWVLKRPLRRAAAWASVWLLLGLPLIVINKLAQPTSHLDTLTPLWSRPFIAGDALAFYLWKLLVPAPLSLDYSRTPSAVLGSGWGYATWLLPAGLFAVLLRAREGHRYLAPAAIFAAGILPVSGLVPFAHQLISTVADRYAYLSLFGAALAVAQALSGLRGRRARAGAAACAAVLLADGALAARQLPFWEDSGALFGHVLDVNPESAIFHSNMAALLWRSGRTEEALREYQSAVRARPSYARARNDMGVLYRALGRMREAADEHRLALVSADPADVARAHVELARLARLSGRDLEAIRQDSQALQARPDSDLALRDLGEIFSGRGEEKKATQYFRLAEDVREARGEPLPPGALETWPARSVARP